MNRLSGLMKFYLVWGLGVMMFFASAGAFGWRIPRMSLPSGGSGVRTGGGYSSHSSWSFGK